MDYDKVDIRDFRLSCKDIPLHEISCLIEEIKCSIIASEGYPGRLFCLWELLDDETHRRYL